MAAPAYKKARREEHTSWDPPRAMHRSRLEEERSRYVSCHAAFEPPAKFSVGMRPREAHNNNNNNNNRGFLRFDARSRDEHEDFSPPQRLSYRASYAAEPVHRFKEREISPWSPPFSQDRHFRSKSSTPVRSNKASRHMSNEERTESNDDDDSLKLLARVSSAMAQDDKDQDEELTSTPSNQRSHSRDDEFQRKASLSFGKSHDSMPHEAVHSPHTNCTSPPQHHPHRHGGTTHLYHDNRSAGMTRHSHECHAPWEPPASYVNRPPIVTPNHRVANCFERDASREWRSRPLSPSGNVSFDDSPSRWQSLHLPSSSQLAAPRVFVGRPTSGERAFTRPTPRRLAANTQRDGRPMEQASRPSIWRHEHSSHYMEHKMPSVVPSISSDENNHEFAESAQKIFTSSRVPSVSWEGWDPESPEQQQQQQPKSEPPHRRNMYLPPTTSPGGNGRYHGERYGPWKNQPDYSYHSPPPPPPPPQMSSMQPYNNTSGMVRHPYEDDGGYYHPPAPPAKHHQYHPYTYAQRFPRREKSKTIIRKKFSWKHYPELEKFLIAHREEYLRHSALNYTAEQKQYNNNLTEKLLEVAKQHNYEFSTEDFNFVAIRDRIRCYYKSFVQTAKKRGEIVQGYVPQAARKRKASPSSSSSNNNNKENKTSSTTSNKSSKTTTTSTTKTENNGE